MIRRRVRPALISAGLLICAGTGVGVWWWAVLRLVLDPGQTGVVEGAVAAGGWGLSLLPVHAAAAGPTGRRLRGRWWRGTRRGGRPCSGRGRHPSGGERGEEERAQPGTGPS